MSGSVTLDRRLPLARSAAVSKAVWISVFVALTCAGALLRIPTQPVPMTFQTPFVLLSGALLGARAGAGAQLAYLALGATGLPVFANGGGAFYLVASPTAGYLLAFPIGAFACGRLAHSEALRRRLSAFGLHLAAMTAGLLLIFAFGTLRLKVALSLDWNTAFVDGFASFQLFDAVKTAGAALVATLLTRR